MSWKPLKGRGLEGKLKEQLYRKLQPLSGGPLTVLALVPRPGTSKAVSGHKIHPYLLRGVSITEPNHVWAADITYIPMAQGFLYLVAIID